MNESAGLAFGAGTIILLIVLLAIGVAFAICLKTVGENQRLLVERMGRYAGCRGCGRHLLIPFLDNGTFVDLDVSLPGWRGMTAERIEQKLIEARYGKDHRRPS